MRGESEVDGEGQQGDSLTTVQFEWALNEGFDEQQQCDRDACDVLENAVEEKVSRSFIGNLGRSVLLWFPIALELNWERQVSLSFLSALVNCGS